MTFKRWSEQHAADVARQFAGSPSADAWTLFGRVIRRALLDSFILDQLRIADSVDSAITLTATEIVGFRDRVAALLAAGVKRHARAMMVSFVVEE